MNTAILKGIGFENFRVFKQQTLLDFAPLTILTGTNSSGKSSVINGLKLIGESFKDIGIYKPELGEVFKCKFNVGDMFKRYGNLGKFISLPDVGEKMKHSFIFSIPVHLLNIDEQAQIEYTISLKDNDLNTGRLTNIHIKLPHSGKLIFSINAVHKNSGSDLDGSSFSAKVDLVFFYEKFLQFMSEQAKFYSEFSLVAYMEERNEQEKRNELSPEFIELVKKLHKEGKAEEWTSEDIKKLEDGRLEELYEEGKLKKMNSEDIERAESKARILFDGKYKKFRQEFNVYTFESYEQLMFSNYSFKKVYLNNLLQDGKFYDFSFLWKENAHDELLFQHAIKKFYNIREEKEVFHSISRDIIQLLANNEWKDSYNFRLFENSRASNSTFSSVEFAKYLNKKNIEYNDAGDEIPHTENERLNYDQIEELKDKKDFLEYLITIMHNNKERSMWCETVFFEDFVTPNLLLINNVFEPIQKNRFESVSSDRANTKGVKSVLDDDDFSRLMKKYFSASTDFEKEAHNRWREFLIKWLKEFKIADDIQFEKEKDYDIFKVRIIKNGREMMLSDEGFGVSQILPVVLSCCPAIDDQSNETGEFSGWGYTSKLVLIEEPETNLHPALQSKLADMFMDAIKTFNIRFVIETHSEYLVRKLQYLTGKGDIKPEDTVIYYFYPPTEVPEGEKQVKKINIQKDGSLTDDFGTGFFDEASNRKFELLELKNHQRN